MGSAHLLPPAHRARFVRHVRPDWDVFRHRAPVDAIERVETWEREGRLRRLAGRVAIDPRHSGNDDGRSLKPSPQSAIKGLDR